MREDGPLRLEIHDVDALDAERSADVRREARGDVLAGSTAIAVDDPEIEIAVLARLAARDRAEDVGRGDLGVGREDLAEPPREQVEFHREAGHPENVARALRALADAPGCEPE